MITRKYLRRLGLLLAFLLVAPSLPGSGLVLSEILTQNTEGLNDEDGATSEWIELYNGTSTDMNLEGWSLTTTTNHSSRWIFPSTNLASAAYLVVFASEKNRRVPGAPLHTHFRLANEEGYVALLSADGSLESEITYANQRKNISFGSGRAAASDVLVGPTSVARAWVPPDATLGDSWNGRQEPFADAGWTAVSFGLGFDLNTTGAAGLLGYWDFNQTTNAGVALDGSGNQHHGSLAGGAAYTADRGGRTGMAGDRAMNFGSAGSNARVVLTDASNGWFESTRVRNAIAFSFWIYGGPSQPAQSSVFWGASGSAGSGTRSAQAHVPWSDSVVYWDTGGTDSSLHRVFVAAPDSTGWKGRWNHYVVLKDKARKEIWQNGRLLLSSTSTAPLASIRSFYIGSGAEGLYNYAGLMDDFAIWNRALLPEEIMALSEGASPGAIGSANAFVKSDVSRLMHGINASIYVRAPFVIVSQSIPDLLILRLRYADGFVAHLNGTEVARRFAPDPLAFDSPAVTELPTGKPIANEELDLTPFVGLLKPGTNQLAFQGLNGSATDNEFLLDPILLAGRSLGQRYFAHPSPGLPNQDGEAALLPSVEVSHRRGFYAEPFTLRFWIPEPGARLIYTLDGTAPSASNGIVAPGTNAELSIDKTTTFRIIAQKADHLTDSVVTHSYLFPAQVAQQSRPSFVGPNWPGGAPADFEIDARVVAGALPSRSFTNALMNLPTMSIVTPLEQLFGAQGIYANASYPKNPATDLELPASVELIYPDGREGFQENAGFQLHGNITRDKGFTPKHGFNVVFRKEYGIGKIRFPMFDHSPADSFDRFVLRAGSTDTWPTINWEDSLVDGVQRWLRDEASYVRDQWVRDAQLDLGQQSARGTYVHLYLDGLYWGLYNLCEHPDDHFAADYYGGEREDYDILADFAEVHAGDKAAWDKMNSMAGAGLSTDAAYQKIQGNNADGTRNLTYPVYLDVTNLVDYMILHVHIGADDWPNHNWWTARKRGADSTGFKFFAWDQEISISSLIRTRSSWGSVYAEADVPETPTYVYARCRANLEFRQLFADRVQLHLFNQGALTVASNLARWDARIREIDSAVVAESARWGDYRRPDRPYTREVEWLSSNAWMRAVFFPSNQTIVMKRFRDARLYPNVGAPRFSQFGGSVPPGFQLALSHTNATGTLFYTRDGTDPRLHGGAISARAESYAGPIEILERTTLSARTRVGTNWSAIVVATFSPTQDFSALRITEIMYNPLPQDGTAGGDFEFLELKNTGAQRLDLSGLAFTEGISFTFANGSRLDPGQFAVLAKNPGRFSVRYPGIPVLGQFEGRLADEGETLRLSTPSDLRIFSVTYGDLTPWPLAADGSGFSLVPSEGPHAATSPEADRWRASAFKNGSPGADDPQPLRAEVMISEVLANSGSTGDWIELANRSPSPADISGWFLTDDPGTPEKYRLPPNTVIPPWGFHIVEETQFGAAAGGNIPFAFSAEGDEVYLFSANAERQLTGASHGFRFEASDAGTPFIRHLNSLGQEFFPNGSFATKGQSNSAPAVGPVVISEIHYHPDSEDLEFVELHNLSDRPIPLFDPLFPANGWRLRGLDFQFSSNAVLAPNGRGLILTADKAGFLQRYPVASNVPCFGPATAGLQDSGERLELVKPRPGTNGVSWVVIDSVRYNDRTPWPPAADGGGPSLQRLEEMGFGDDPANWIAARPTPGEGLPEGLPPRFGRQPAHITAVEGGTISFAAEALGGAPLLYQWQRNGEALPSATNSALTFASVTPDDAGEYRVSVYNDAGAILSSNATLTVLRLPFIYSQPQNRAVATNASVTLLVAVSGTGPVHYQWLLNGQEVLNATAPTLRINSMNQAIEGLYSVRVTDDVGTVQSRSALIELLRRVSIVMPPQSQTVLEGEDVALRVETAGTLPIRYQWKRGLTVLLNTNSASHTSIFRLTQIKPTQAGNYSVTLLNQAVGPVNSPAVSVVVLPDSDRDRMPNEWEITFGLNPNSSLDADQDPDQDGFSNREEYQAGTDPLDVASRLMWSGIARTGAAVSLSFQAVSNKTYSVLFTDTLDGGAWNKLSDLTGSSRTELRTIEEASGAPGPRFYRLITPAQP